jgi:hypothetical protein
LTVVWAALWRLGLCVVEMPYLLDERLETEVESDDNPQAVQRTRLRVAKGLNATYGVLMVSTAEELGHAVHTIPIWKEYCRRHKFDFFLQEELLSPSVRSGWTKPRVLMEMMAQAKWKYVWVVDSNSLPVDLDKSWTYAIKAHLRQIRYNNDNQKKRIVWCPEDCEQDYSDATQEGACYGPHMSGCIFWMKADKLNPLLKGWYAKRKSLDSDNRGVKRAFKMLREANYDWLYFSDVGKEMGRPDSSFLATHSFDAKLNLRDQVIRTIGKHKALGAVLNKHGEHKPEL